MADNAVLARNTDNAPVKEGLHSQTVAFSHYNHLTAQLPLDASGALIGGGAREQADQCLANIKAILESIEHGLDDVVRLTAFVTDLADLGAVDEAVAAVYGEYRPTRTNVGVAALPEGAAVMIEAVVSNGVGTIPNAPQAGDLVKVARDTDRAPKSEFSTQSVAFSHYCNLSAQLPLDPETGTLVDGGVAEQAKQALDNVKAILESIDVPFDDIVKVNVFLTDLGDVAAVDEVYTTFFPDSAIARAVGYLPARTIIPAAALPEGAKVQVEAVVSFGDGTPPQEVEDRHGIVIWADDTDQAVVDPHSTQTVRFSHYNNVSGQLPVDPASGKLVDGDVAAQAERVFSSLKAIVESVDHSLEDTVRVCLYLTDLADLEAVEGVAAKFFGGVPARRVVGVSALPVEGAKVMADLVLGNAEGTPPRN